MDKIEKSRELYDRLIPLLEQGEQVALHPNGTSMFPLFVSPKDFVYLKFLGEREPQKGDVILYQRTSGLLVLHRLCKVTEVGYFFVGDNQTKVEGPLERQQLLAVATGFERKGKYFSEKHLAYRVCAKLWLLLRPVRPIISRPLGIVWRRCTGR